MSDHHEPVQRLIMRSIADAEFERAERAEYLLALATAFMLPRARPDDVLRVERTGFPPHSESWSVRDVGCCVNRNLEPEYEPMPSCRDEAFLARCRWTTRAEAIEAAAMYRLRRDRA